MGIDMNRPREWQEADSSDYLFADAATIGMTKVSTDRGIVVAPVITLEVKPPDDAPMQKPIYVLFPMDMPYARKVMQSLSEVMEMVENGVIPQDDA